MPSFSAEISVGKRVAKSSSASRVSLHTLVGLGRSLRTFSLTVVDLHGLFLLFLLL
jgi:hypothetical protein